MGGFHDGEAQWWGGDRAAPAPVEVDDTDDDDLLGWLEDVNGDVILEVRRRREPFGFHTNKEQL